MRRLALVSSTLAAVAVFALILFYSWRPIANYDIFWHMATGRLIVEQSQIPTKNTFNYPNPNDAYQNEVWLFDLASHLFWLAAGVGGLCSYRALVVLLMFAFVLFGLLRRRVPLAVGLAFILLSLLLIEFRFLTRNFLLSYLFFALYLYFLPSGDRRSQKVALVLYPLIMVFWANLHIGCSVGVALVGLGFVASLFKGSDDFPRPRYWLALLLVVFAASGVSPYPFLWIKRSLYNLVVYVPQRTLEEQPAHPGEFGFFYAVWALALVLGIWRFRRLHPFWLLGIVALGAASAAFLRFIGFFGLFLPLFLGEVYLTFASERDRSVPSAERGRSFALAVILIVFCIGRAWTGYSSRAVGCRIDCELLPCGAADLMKDCLISGPIYNTWGLGGFLEWKLFPMWSTFWDSRSYGQIQKANRVRAEGLSRILQDYGVGYALLAMRSSGSSDNVLWFERIFLSPDWVPIYFDRSSALLVNRAVYPELASELGFFAIRPLTRELPIDPEGLDLAFSELERAKYLVGHPDMFLTQTEIRLLIRKGMLDEAQRVLLSGVELWPGAASLYALGGELYLKLNRPRDAVDCLKEARKLGGDSASVLNNLGIAYWQLEKFSKAIRCFKRALEHDSGFAPAIYNLHLIYKELGDDEKSQRWRQRYEQIISPSAPARGR